MAEEAEPRVRLGKAEGRDMLVRRLIHLSESWVDEGEVVALEERRRMSMERVRGLEWWRKLI